MAKNPTAEQFATYVELRQNGTPAHEAQAAAKLSHSQAEFHWLRTQPQDQGGMAELVGQTEATAANVAALRASGESWGRIAVHIDRPEGTARKLYSESTGTKSQGQRIGKGGRFYYTDHELYTDALKGTGTVIQVGETHEQASAAAEEQRTLLSQDVAELKATYKAEVGKAAPAQYTKTQLVIGIRKARAAKAEGQAPKARKPRTRK